MKNSFIIIRFLIISMIVLVININKVEAQIACFTEGTGGYDDTKGNVIINSDTDWEDDYFEVTGNIQINSPYTLQLPDLHILI